MKQQYLLDKKEYCEAKLMEKREARRAAKELDEMYANMTEEDDGDGDVTQQNTVSSANTDELDENRDNESCDVDNNDSTNVSSGGGGGGVVGSLSSTLSAVCVTESSGLPTDSVFNFQKNDIEEETSRSDNDSDDNDDNYDDDEQEEEEQEEEQEEGGRLQCFPPGSLTPREVRCFVKDFFNNTFPDRVVSHVTNHEGVHIYKNKLAMQKVKRRDVQRDEVERNEELQAQLPYLPDIKSYKFYFVQ